MALNSEASLKLSLSLVKVVVKCCCFPLIMYMHMLVALQYSSCLLSPLIMQVASLPVSLSSSVVSTNSCWWISVVHDQQCFCCT